MCLYFQISMNVRDLTSVHHTESVWTQMVPTSAYVSGAFLCLQMAEHVKVRQVIIIHSIDLLLLGGWEK